MSIVIPTYTPTAIRVGDWVTVDGADYRVCEYDPATEQFFVLRHGADAGEFLSAPRLEWLLQAGEITLAVRQLALSGLGGDETHA